MNPAPKILIVDDNPVVLLGVSELLRSAGYDVLEARTAAEGLDRVQEHRPDLVLLDVMLPDANGVDLCRQMKSDPALRPLFVVLLSSIETSSGSQAAGLDAGADGYIARPIENRELLARVQALLRIQQAEAALRQAQDELDRAVMERTADLARANSDLRAMSLRLVELQEAERRFLARELHDEIGQTLTGLKITLDQSLSASSGPLRDRLSNAAESLGDLLGRTRELSLRLRPPMLDDLGLVAALEAHFQQYTKQTNIQVQFQRTPVPDRLPALVESTVFRIVQEALTNVARHAQVSSVKVRLWVDPLCVRIQVEDEGRGFDSEAVRRRHASSGLAGMKERADLMGGEFTLETQPGRGARLTVELPVAPGVSEGTRNGPLHDHRCSS